jgi:flagellar biosynthesis protein FliP
VSPARYVLLALAALLPLAAQAQSLPALTSSPAPGGGTAYSLPVSTLLLLAGLTFLPAVVLVMSSFTRIIIVFSLLRSALGTHSAPPNQVLAGLALFLSLFVMAPVLDKLYTEAYLPLSENRIGFEQALERAAVPLKGFMLKQVREPDLSLFARLSKTPKVDRAEDLPMRVVIPAFITSELKTAFQIGFIVMIPFLIIDMVVASVLMSMGMMMTSPAIIALPFKIMLFVLVDGWNLLIGSLLQSFG